MLEPIDYSIVDKSKVRPEHAVEWGIGNYIYAMVLTYNTKKWGGMVPTTWADVWDVKKFPGKRAFRREPDGVLEAALMADGVPYDKIYPIDMKRALDMHKKIKEHTIYYNVIADGQNAFRNGEVALGQLLNTRAWPLKQDTKGVCDWTWNQGISWGACWMVPKGATGGKAIWDFINSRSIRRARPSCSRPTATARPIPRRPSCSMRTGTRSIPARRRTTTRCCRAASRGTLRTPPQARQDLIDALAG